MHAHEDVPASGRPAVEVGVRRHIPVREIPLPHVCPRPVRMRVLTRVPYFADLDQTQIGLIDDRMQATSWHADEVLYREGEHAGHLYVVAAGRVRLGQTTATGAETVADILVPGELFGELDALGDPVHRQTATAMVASCVLRIDRGAFRAVLREHPDAALRVLDDVASRLSRAQEGEGPATTVAQRVASALLRLADKLGHDRGAEGILIEVPLSRADLAGLARSTPESVSRVMSRWKRDGVVDTGRRWTAVRDVPRLRAEAAGE